MRGKVNYALHNLKITYVHLNINDNCLVQPKLALCVMHVILTKAGLV